MTSLNPEPSEFCLNTLEVLPYCVSTMSSKPVTIEVEPHGHAPALTRLGDAQLRRLVDQVGVLIHKEHE